MSSTSPETPAQKAIEQWDLHMADLRNQLAEDLRAHVLVDGRAIEHIIDWVSEALPIEALERLVDELDQDRIPPNRRIDPREW